MSKMVQINFDPDSRTLRNFGYIAFVGFGLIALMAWTESFLFTFGLGGARQPLTYIFAGLSVYCLLMGILWPKANKPVFVGLSVVTFPIGILLSYTIMALLFFGLFGVFSAAFRLVRYDPMKRSIDPTARSYWSQARPPRERSDYFRQY